MRQLDTYELLEKFNDYSSDINYTDFQHIDIKVDQLFHFLDEQDISKRILERISDEFNDLKIFFKTEKYSRDYNFYAQVKKQLNTREKQGSFAYFAMREKFGVDQKYSNHYIELPDEWYDPTMDYNDAQKVFNTYFFEPFSEIIDWYIRESKTNNANDYFSYEAQEEISYKLVQIEEKLTKLGLGQEVVFNEINDVKKLTKRLNKKIGKKSLKVSSPI